MTEASQSFKPLPMNADRVCEGISKIGYQPSAAIMDIVDNSVAAGATKVQIHLVLSDGATTSVTGGVERIRIIDNGEGMTDAQIETALELGSGIEYPKNSLSKFGFGLKSAGFSLGGRIQVVSKTKKGLSAVKFVDRDVIREMNQYGVCTESITDEAADLEEFKTGTIIEISKPKPRQDSAAKIRRDLNKKLGVIYYEFLAKGDKNISMTVEVHGAKVEVQTIEPVDILHWDQTKAGFDPDNYDGKTPINVCDKEVENPADPSGPKFRVQMAIFPQKGMAGYPGFTKDEREQIKSYDIERENSGWFFYRNGRLVRWGDNIAGAGRDDIGFRAKVSFQTAHDDLLHVDVSKQNLAIPEETEEALKLLARLPLSQSRLAFDRCKAMLKASDGNEGADFNRRSETFEESDPVEEVNPPPPEEKKKRRQKLAEATEALEAAEAIDTAALGDEVVPADEEVPEIFQKVRYIESTGDLSLALPGWDDVNGSYVRINKSHPFYQLVLAKLPAADPNRLSVEALLLMMAIGENKTHQNLASVKDEDISAVFSRFRMVLSQNLHGWVASNQDLFG